MKLPWKCDDCGHSLADSPFVTYVGCPECESENFFHGSMVEEEKEICEECNIDEALVTRLRMRNGELVKVNLCDECSGDDKQE
jgi:protein-arginine kinase activator protein McsA